MTSKKPILTIAIISHKRLFNNYNYLKSLKDLQTDGKISVLIVDDNAEKYFQCYLKSICQNFNFKYNYNNLIKGANGARTLALKLCDTEWLLMCDDDDELYLELITDKLRDTTAEFVVMNGNNRKKVSPYCVELLHNNNYLNGFSGVIISQRIFKAVSLDCSLRNAQDWDFFKSITQFNAEIWNDKNYYSYSVDGQRITSRKWSIRKFAFHRVLARQSQKGVLAKKLSFNLYAFFLLEEKIIGLRSGLFVFYRILDKIATFFHYCFRR